MASPRASRSNTAYDVRLFFFFLSFAARPLAHAQSIASQLHSHELRMAAHTKTTTITLAIAVRLP